MKKIFVGSSKGALPQAQDVAALLDSIDGVEALLWTDIFKVGDINFLSIDAVAGNAAGAVFLATPDDDSVLRGKPAKVPRSNVIFEYGYLTARLGLNRVALCKYNNVELPSDFKGITNVPMGEFTGSSRLNHDARAKLRTWATDLPTVQPPLPVVLQVHGYSGVWEGDGNYSLWRGIDIKTPDYGHHEFKMLLHLPIDGRDGSGCLYGTWHVEIGKCYAEFEVNDTITHARVLNDGSVDLSLVHASRQLTKLDGDAPQEDGFEQMLRGPKEFGLRLTRSDKPGVLNSEFMTKSGNLTRSKAKYVFRRPEIPHG